MPFYLDVLKAVHLFSHHLLPVYVAFVFHLYLRSLRNFLVSVRQFCDGFFQRGHDFSDGLEVELWTTYEVGKFAAFAEWGSAKVFEGTVYVVFPYVCRLAESDDFFDSFFFLHPVVVAFPCGKSQCVCLFCQSSVGIVLSEQYSVFCS